MDPCAYCDSHAGLTIAGLVPDWYRPDGPGCVFRSDKLVVDVCAACRSRLAEAAAYAAQLFTGDLPGIVFRDTTASVDFDHARLLRWLLALSFDAARVHGENVGVLAQYRDVATGRAPIPPEVQLWFRTIAPTTPAGTVLAPARTVDPTVARPRWFRVGRLGVDEFGCQAWSFRQVAIDSHCFALLLPDLSRLEQARDERIIQHEAIDAALGDPIWIGPNTRRWLPQPADDAISFTLTNAGLVPLGCEYVEDARLAAALSSKPGLVELRIPREEIEAGNIAPTLAFLAGVVATRESCLRMQQRLSIVVDGYQGDAWSLLGDHNAVAWLLALDREWPYWMFFQHPAGRWLKLASIWLGNPARDEFGDTRLDPQALGDTVRNWYLGLNQLCYVLGIDEQTHGDLSRQAHDLLMQD